MNMDLPWVDELNRPPTPEEEVTEAIESVSAFLEEDAPWWGRAREVSARLAAATDALNEQLRRVEETFTARRCLPGSVDMGDGDFLVWDGEKLVYAKFVRGQYQEQALLKASREMRSVSVVWVKALYDRLLQG